MENIFSKNKKIKIQRVLQSVTPSPAVLHISGKVYLQSHRWHTVL